MSLSSNIVESLRTLYGDTISEGTRVQISKQPEYTDKQYNEAYDGAKDTWPLFYDCYEDTAKEINGNMILMESGKEIHSDWVRMSHKFIKTGR